MRGRLDYRVFLYGTDLHVERSIWEFVVGATVGRRPPLEPPPPQELAWVEGCIGIRHSESHSGWNGRLINIERHLEAQAGH